MTEARHRDAFSCFPEPPPENKRYEAEKPTAILPPPATVTQPGTFFCWISFGPQPLRGLVKSKPSNLVFVPIPVPDRRESLVKEVEREIRIVAPPKPETADVGKNSKPKVSEK